MKLWNPFKKKKQKPRKVDISQIKISNRERKIKELEKEYEKNNPDELVQSYILGQIELLKEMGDKDNKK